MLDSTLSIVSFDVDGTIFRRPALRQAAHALGLQAAWDRIDDRFDAKDITLRERLESHYRLLRGIRLTDLLREVAKVQVIEHVPEVVDRLQASGLQVVLLTDLPDFLCADLIDRFGFDASIASKVGIRDGIVRGVIEPLPDKKLGLETYCSRISRSMSDCAHVGDGLNDVPVFEAVGYSIALNSRIEKVRASASYHLTTDDLLDVYRHLQSIDPALGPV
jgi:phosphoserine phosphatase